MSTARRKQPGSRQAKLLRIGQAHLAPGMTLARWQPLLDRHRIGRDWGDVSDQTIDAIVAAIAAIVNERSST